MDRAKLLLTMNFKEPFAVEGHEEDIDIIYFHNKDDLKSPNYKLHNLGFETAICDNCEKDMSITYSDMNMLEDIKKIYKNVYPINDSYLVNFIDSLNSLLSRLDKTNVLIPYFDPLKAVYSEFVDMDDNKLFESYRISKEYIVTENGVFQEVSLAIYLKTLSPHKMLLIHFFINNALNKDGFNYLIPTESKTDKYSNQDEIEFNDEFLFKHITFQLRHSLKKVTDIEPTIENFGDMFNLLEILSI